MDYEKEFYETIEKEKNRIKSFDISDNEKNNLYKLVDKTIQRYEESKIRLEINSKLIKTLDKMGKGLEKSISAGNKIKDELPNLKEIVAENRIKEKIFPQNNTTFPNN
jgi:hypothetical protein